MFCVVLGRKEMTIKMKTPQKSCAADDIYKIFSTFLSTTLEIL